MKRIVFCILIMGVSVFANMSTIYPLVSCEENTNSYLKGTKTIKKYPQLRYEIKTGIWIKEDITDNNKVPFRKKTRYILNGNYFTKISDNEFEKKGFGNATEGWHKVYQRIVIDDIFMTVTTVRKNGDTDKTVYRIGVGVHH